MQNEVIHDLFEKVKVSKQPIWISERTVNILLKEADVRFSKKELILEINTSKGVFQVVISINEIENCEELLLKLEKVSRINYHTKIPTGKPIYVYPEEASILDVLIL